MPCVLKLSCLSLCRIIRCAGLLSSWRCRIRVHICWPPTLKVRWRSGSARLTKYFTAALSSPCKRRGMETYMMVCVGFRYWTTQTTTTPDMTADNTGTRPTPLLTFVQNHTSLLFRAVIYPWHLDALCMFWLSLLSGQRVVFDLFYDVLCPRIHLSFATDLSHINKNAVHFPTV